MMLFSRMLNEYMMFYLLRSLQVYMNTMFLLHVLKVNPFHNFLLMNSGIILRISLLIESTTTHNGQADWLPTLTRVSSSTMNSCIFIIIKIQQNNTNTLFIYLLFGSITKLKFNLCIQLHIVSLTNIITNNDEKREVTKRFWQSLLSI